MNWRTTAALFVILVALAGVVYWQSRQEPSAAETTPTPPSPAAETTSLFPGATTEQLLRLEVERAEDGAAVHFQRQDDAAWTQTVPTTTVAISRTLESNAGSLLALSSRRALSPDENPLSAYGLDQPAATILVAVRRTAEDAENSTEQTIRHTLHVGNQTPAEDGYYVQKVGDRRVHIVPTTPVDAVLDLIDDPPHQSSETGP